jgi:NADPH-dependent 2,4-dienoyl-CoA reductase/sulfur reductase-like enzyme
MTLATARSNGKEGVVIVGGGLASQRCAETLRREGYSGTVRIVCAEAHRPYDRPPLSKELLTGSRAHQTLAYRPAAWYEQQSVDLVLDVRASGLRPAERRVELSDGTRLGYLRLLIATGSRPRMLKPLAACGNVSVLRSLDDALALREVLAEGPRLAVIGAGFIGQEVAATARGLGAEVTIVEAATTPLESVLGRELGSWFARMHRDEGVNVLCGTTVERIDGERCVRRLHLSSGETLEPDHIVVGVGVDADTAWLANSGLEWERGVPVDEHGRTEIAGVLAAGDAAATFDSGLGRHVPGSHWEAAGRQGARAARVMLGLTPGAAPPTSFWTDQYGVRIQYLGHASLADSVRIDGDPGARDFTATFTRGGRPVAALLVGPPRQLPAIRKQFEKGTT